MTTRKPVRVNLDTGEIDYGQGWVSYAYLERLAVCTESGMSEEEAARVAGEDEQRSLERGKAQRTR